MTSPPVSTASTDGVATRLGGVDGMRAIAAGFVFAYHGSVLLGLGGFMARHWDVVGLFGSLGVCIFFVISGFLLFGPFVGAILGDRPMPHAGPFWLRRSLRILPAYWVAMTLLWLVFDQVVIPNGGDFATYFGLLQNYRTGYVDGGLDVAWTLVIEMSFYLVLPFFAALLMVLARRAHEIRTRYVIALGGAFAWFFVGMGLRIWDIWFRQSPPSPRGEWFALSQMMRWLPGYLHWFAGGMVLAVVVEWARRGHPLTAFVRFLGDHPWVSWAIAGACLAVDIGLDIPQNVYDGTRMQGFLLTLFTPLFATFLVLPAVVGHPRSLIRRGLAWAPLAWVGLVSYGVYLWHRPVMHEVITHTSGSGFRTGVLWFGLRYAIAFVITLAIAAASYYVVERPCIRLSHRWSGRWSRVERSPRRVTEARS